MVVRLTLLFLSSIFHWKTSSPSHELDPRSVLVIEDTVVVWGNSPVLSSIVFVWIVFLVVGEEVVQLDALSEILLCLKASDMLHHIEVAEDVHAGAHQPVPVHALDLDVSMVLLELKLDSLSEVDVRPLDRVHVFTGHLELIEVVVLWEHLHI